MRPLKALFSSFEVVLSGFAVFDQEIVLNRGRVFVNDLNPVVHLAVLPEIFKTGELFAIRGDTRPENLGRKYFCERIVFGGESDVDDGVIGEIGTLLEIARVVEAEDFLLTVFADFVDQDNVFVFHTFFLFV